MSDLKLLIIDDEENMCHMLKAMLEQYGYHVSTVTDGAKGLELIEKTVFDFVLCDVRMPKMDGIEFIKQGRTFLAHSTLIMMSAFGSVETAMEAMKAGAYDFISKPFKSDEVLLTLKKAEERELLRQENRELKEKIASIQSDMKLGSMIAQSESMTQIIEITKNVARYDTTVLVTGESGTGKELIARAVHDNSERSLRPLVAINCGSIPDTLIESELFGYVRGAFTGADHTRKGVFHQADGSSLFLDEIGELSLAMQVKLLRVIQEGEVRRVGASKTEKIDVRIITATARNLHDCVSRGTFREDLFYRLNVLPIELPPLRKRVDDIPPLCHHFIKKFNKFMGTNVVGLSPESMSLILKHTWPGNIRELENAIQRGIVLTGSKYIEPEHLPPVISEPAQRAIGGEGATEDIITLKAAQKMLERKMIMNALKAAGGNKSLAARTLDVSYPSLLSKIKEYKL